MKHRAWPNKWRMALFGGAVWLALPMTVAALFNFSLDTLLGRHQSQSKAQCADCAGAIRAHVVAPSASPWPLSLASAMDPRMEAFARAMRSPASVGLLVLQGSEIQFEG